MISNKKELYNFLDKILSAHGYIKKKETWYNQTSECIRFFAVEKSDYCGQFGQAFGCFVKGVPITSTKEFPEYYKAHLRIGLSFFVDREIVAKAFDLENNQFHGEERETVISDLITYYVLPFLKEIDTKQGIKKAYKKYPKLKYSMYLTLKEKLGLPTED